MKATQIVTALGLLGLASGCRGAPFNPEGTVKIPGGPFITGSSLDERGHGLELSYAANGGVVPDGASWVGNERERHKVDVASFRLMQEPVTQYEYYRYLVKVGVSEPWIDPQGWEQTDTGIPYATIGRFSWHAGRPQKSRVHHPVVLVNHDEALAYCRWWGNQRGGIGGLPTELQWEKAARGPQGRIYPWGNTYDAERTNTLENQRNDTLAVGTFPRGASPYGVLDMAGNVFEWTDSAEGDTAYVIKGGSWSADGGQARPAARHTRHAGVRHIALGFRCTLQEKPKKRRWWRRGKPKSNKPAATTKPKAPSKGAPPETTTRPPPASEPAVIPSAPSPDPTDSNRIAVQPLDDSASQTPAADLGKPVDDTSAQPVEPPNPNEAPSNGPASGAEIRAPAVANPSDSPHAP